EQRSENSKRANERPDIDPGWNKQSPRGRKKIAMQTADDDNEALEPHSGVDAHANKIDDQNVATAPAEPEELRRKNIAEQHADPPVPPIRTEHAIIKRELLVSVAAVPGHEKFHGVGVADE